MSHFGTSPLKEDDNRSNKIWLKFISVYIIRLSLGAGSKALPIGLNFRASPSNNGGKSNIR